MATAQVRRASTLSRVLVLFQDSFKDYDFENRLEVRIHAALRRLKEEGTPV